MEVPAVHTGQHTGNVAKTISSCQMLAPKKTGSEAIRHFNAIVSQMSDISPGARNNLRNYIFCGDPNLDQLIADKYVQFVLDSTARQIRYSSIHFALFLRLIF